MYLRCADFRFPDDIKRLYPDNYLQPVHFEVGFGDGRFWTIQRHFDGLVNYFGVDISGASTLRAINRFGRESLQNAILAHLPAEFVVQNIIPSTSLARVYVNFPDPWPKTRHSESRLLRPQFFELLSTRLQSNGELWLTTDHQEYFEFAIESAESTNLYSIEIGTPPPATLQTKYAIRWQSMGIEIMHARFKVLHTSSKVFPSISIFSTEEKMLHIGLKNANIDRIPSDKVVFREGEFTAIILNHFSRENATILLVRIEELGIAQEVLIEAVRKNDKTILKLSSFGNPLITPGVKRTLERTAQLLDPSWQA